jgi:hypothetical protein
MVGFSLAWAVARTGAVGGVACPVGGAPTGCGAAGTRWFGSNPALRRTASRRDGGARRMPPMAREDDRSRRRLRITIALPLLVHAAALTFLARVPVIKPNDEGQALTGERLQVDLAAKPERIPAPPHAAAPSPPRRAASPATRAGPDASALAAPSCCRPLRRPSRRRPPLRRGSRRLPKATCGPISRRVVVNGASRDPAVPRPRRATAKEAASMRTSRPIFPRPPPASPRRTGSGEAGYSKSAK